MSTPSVVLPGYPPGGGTRTPPGGYPGQVPPRGGTRSGTPPRGTQTPPGGYPVRYPPRGYPDPPRGGTQSGTPRGGYPDPPAAPWHSGKCCKALWDMGTPPRCGQTNKVKLLPSRRTTYAGGKNLQIICHHAVVVGKRKISGLVVWDIFLLYND